MVSAHAARGHVSSLTVSATWYATEDSHSSAPVAYFDCDFEIETRGRPRLEGSVTVGGARLSR